MKRRRVRILVLQTAGIGDLILSLPSIAALKNSFPDAEIDLMLHQRSRGLFEARNLQIHSILYIDILQSRNIIYFLKHSISLIKDLRQRRYDLVIDLYQVASWYGALRRFVFLLLINGGKSVGRNTDGKGFFYDVSVPGKLFDKRHESLLMFDVVRKVSDSTHPCSIELPDIEEYRQAGRKLLSDLRIDGQGDMIVFLPCAFDKRKRWDKENFVELAKRIKKEITHNIILVGCEAEEKELLEISDSFAERLKIVVNHSLKSIAGLFLHTRIVVANDTGITHLAGAAGCDIVVLFGENIGHPERFSPSGRGNITVIHKKSLSDITVAEVYEAISKMLKP